MAKNLVFGFFGLIASMTLIAAEVAEMAPRGDIVVEPRDEKEAESTVWPKVWHDVIRSIESDDAKQRAEAIENLRQFILLSMGPAAKKCWPKRNRHSPLLEISEDHAFDLAILAELPQKSACGLTCSREMHDLSAFRDKVGWAALLQLAKMENKGLRNIHYEDIKYVVNNIESHFGKKSEYVNKFLAPLMERGIETSGNIETLAFKALAHRLLFDLEEVAKKGEFNPVKIEYFSPNFTPEASLALVMAQESSAVVKQRAYKKYMDRRRYAFLFIAFSYLGLSVLERFGSIENPFNLFLYILGLWTLSVAQDEATQKFCRGVHWVFPPEQL